jgi:cell division protein FtsB
MVKETFFSEYEKLKAENERLKTELAQMQEPKPIVHNPEPTEKVKVEAPKSTRDIVMKFINQ